MELSEESMEMEGKSPPSGDPQDLVTVIPIPPSPYPFLPLSLPYELLKEIISDFRFSDFQSVYWVCKSWQSLLSAPERTEEILQQLHRMKVYVLNTDHPRDARPPITIPDVMAHINANLRFYYPVRYHNPYGKLPFRTALACDEGKGHCYLLTFRSDKKLSHGSDGRALTYVVNYPGFKDRHSEETEVDAEGTLYSVSRAIAGHPRHVKCAKELERNNSKRAFAVQVLDGLVYAAKNYAISYLLIVLFLVIGSVCYPRFVLKPEYGVFGKVMAVVHWPFWVVYLLLLMPLLIVHAQCSIIIDWNLHFINGQPPVKNIVAPFSSSASHYLKNFVKSTFSFQSPWLFMIHHSFALYVSCTLSSVIIFITILVVNSLLFTLLIPIKWKIWWSIPLQFLLMVLHQSANLIALSLWAATLFLLPIHLKDSYPEWVEAVSQNSLKYWSQACRSDEITAKNMTRAFYVHFTSNK